MKVPPARFESFYIRARIYDELGKTELAIADLRRAIEFPAQTPFEISAQLQARTRIEQLSKRIPCSSQGPGECL